MKGLSCNEPKSDLDRAVEFVKAKPDFMYGGRYHRWQTVMLEVSRYGEVFVRGYARGKQTGYFILSKGVVNVTLAHCGQYTLSYRPLSNTYHAGCRAFTRTQALKHWGNPKRTDDRAILFEAVIRAFRPQDVEFSLTWSEK